MMLLASVAGDCLRFLNWGGAAFYGAGGALMALGLLQAGPTLAARTRGISTPSSNYAEVDVRTRRRSAVALVVLVAVAGAFVAKVGDPVFPHTAAMLGAGSEGVLAVILNLLLPRPAEGQSPPST